MEKTAGPKKMSPLMARLTQSFTVWRKEPIITVTAMSIPRAQARAAMDTAMRLRDPERYRQPRLAAGHLRKGASNLRPRKRADTGVSKAKPRRIRKAAINPGQGGPLPTGDKNPRRST